MGRVLMHLHGQGDLLAHWGVNYVVPIVGNCTLQMLNMFGG
jgi:hypothetical protein